MKTRDIFRRQWTRSFYVRVFDREYRFQIVAEFKPTFAARTIGKAMAV